MFAGEKICIRAGLTVDEAAKFIVALLTLVNVVLLSTLCACGIGLKMIFVLFRDMSKCSALTGEPLCRRRGLWKDCTVSVQVISSFIALPHP